VSKIVRPAHEYESAYRARLKRLRQQQPIEKGDIRQKFEKCIQLTDSCNERALQLATLARNAIEYRTKGNEFILGLVDKFFTTMTGGIADESGRTANQKSEQEAMQLYRRMLDDSRKPEIGDKSIADWLNENIKAPEDISADIYEVNIKTQFTLIHST